MGSYIFFKFIPLRESIPRWVDKKSRGPRRREGSGVLEEEIRVWGSQEGRRDNVYFSTLLSLSHTKQFFSFKPGTDYYTIQFKFCTRDYITTMYPA